VPCSDRHGRGADSISALLIHDASLLWSGAGCVLMLAKCGILSPFSYIDHMVHVVSCAVQRRSVSDSIINYQKPQQSSAWSSPFAGDTLRKLYVLAVSSYPIIWRRTTKQHAHCCWSETRSWKITTTTSHASWGENGKGLEAAGFDLIKLRQYSVLHRCSSDGMAGRVTEEGPRDAGRTFSSLQILSLGVASCQWKVLHALPAPSSTMVRRGGYE